jgi:hypothetical protein
LIAKLGIKKEGKTTENHLVKPSFYSLLVVLVWVISSGKVALASAERERHEKFSKSNSRERI